MIIIDFFPCYLSSYLLRLNDRSLEAQLPPADAPEETFHPHVIPTDVCCDSYY